MDRYHRCLPGGEGVIDGLFGDNFQNVVRDGACREYGNDMLHPSIQKVEEIDVL